MRKEEISQAEQLLGNLAKDILSKEGGQVDNLTKGKNKFRLFLILSAYSIIMYLLIDQMFSQQSAFSIFLTSGLVIGLITINTLKHLFLFNNYSIDLRDDDINYKQFTLMQTFLSSFFFLLVVMLIGFIVGSLSNFTFTLLSVITSLSLIAIIYVRFADLVMISQGFGMGVVALNRGVAGFIENFKRSNDLSNSYTTKAAIIRLIFVVVLVYVRIYGIHPAYLIILSIVLIPILHTIEIKNASTLFMRIRGEISELIPGSIPDDIFLEDDAPYPLAIPQKIKFSGHRSLFKNNPASIIAGYSSKAAALDSPSLAYKKERREATSIPDDISPYAARTLKRIINKVKNEGPLQRRGMNYCGACGSQIIGGGKFCSTCGINQVN